MKLSTKEAAARLGIQVATLERYRTAGKGPNYEKVGRTVLYSERELQRWIDQRPARGRPLKVSSAE